MKKASVIRHVAFEDLGTLSPALVDAGYEIKYYEAGISDLIQILDEDPSLLVILGGPIGAYEEVDYPFIQTELTILEDRLDRGAPTLGICLGAQLMARALGAEVVPGDGKEIGWHPIKLTDSGTKSCLAPLDGGEIHVLHWHGDTFSIPENAKHLAMSEFYPNQAFSWGEFCLALQFHPEITRKNMERWYLGHALEISQTPGVSVKLLREGAEKFADMLEQHAKEVWSSWLDQLSNHAEVATV